MAGQKTKLDSSGLCFKYLLIIINIFYFIAGCVAVGVSLWIYLRKDYMSDIVGSELMSLGSIFIVVVCGCLAVFFSLLGLVSAIFENTCMILSYFVGLLILFIALVTAGVLGLVFRAEIDESIRNEMKVTLQNEYGVKLHEPYNRALTRAWNMAQEELECCAVDENGWATYRSSEWYKIQEGIEEADKPFVPKSCCVQDVEHQYVDLQKCQTFYNGPPGTPSGGEYNYAVHYSGCYYRGKDFIHEMSGIIIGLGLGIGLSIIFGMVCAVILYIKISRR